MQDLLDAIRRIVDHWVNTTVKLTQDAPAGSNVITVATTNRWEKGDEFLIRNADEYMENFLYVDCVVDETHLRLTEPLKFSWLVAQDAALIRTIKGTGNFVKGIQIGEPDIITDFPFITVTGVSRSSEWYTIRGTKERYNIEIGVFVQDGSMEAGYRQLLTLTDTIQKGLKRNIIPLVNSYQQTALTADAAKDDTFLKVADSSILMRGGYIIIENLIGAEQHQIAEIIDATTIEVSIPINHDFSKTDTTVIRPYRFMYNSWPADIQFIKIFKGTLLKAAVISFFAEEYEAQIQGGWSDTQLA